ncbi:uncharacterized protein isoform X2 [Leptinotarsa decemlineata]|uniref:uncharacterized protein isoform X2 n=1 Tax=Leptinotarsa decemlineata TaxID=7539 RepID=UPI003D305852
MESENGEKGFDEHSCPISEKINETVKDSMGNLETVEEVNHTLAEFNEDIAHESKKPLEDDVTVVREKRNTSDLVNDKEVDTGLSDRELDKDGFNRDMALQENTTEKLLNFDESKIENSNKKIEQGDDSDKIIDEGSQIENVVDEGSSFHEMASPVSDKKIDEKKTNDGLIDSEVIENELDHSMKDVSDREKSAIVEKSDVSEKLDESEVSTKGNIDFVCGNEVIGAIGTDGMDAEKKGKMDGDTSIDGETSATNKSKEDVTDVLGRSQKDEDDSHNDSSRIITGENPIGDSKKEENAQSDQFSQFEKNETEESPEETIEKREVTGNATDIGGRNTQFEVSNDPLLETASPECEINEEDKHGKKHNISDTSTGQKQLSSMSSDKNETISEDDFADKKGIVENDTSNGSETILDSQKIPVKNDDEKIEKSNGNSNDKELSHMESEADSVEKKLNVDENTHTNDHIESIMANDTQTLSETKQLTSNDTGNSESEEPIMKSDKSNLVSSECEVRKIVNQGETDQVVTESDKKNSQQNDESSSAEILSQKENDQIINKRQKLLTGLSSASETGENGEKSVIPYLNEYKDDSSGTKNKEVSDKENNNQNETEISKQNETIPTEAVEDVCIQNKIAKLNQSADENKIDETPPEPEVGKLVNQRGTGQDETQSDHETSLQDDKGSSKEISIQKENEGKESAKTQEVPVRLVNDSETDENDEKSQIVTLNECRDVASNSKDMKMHEEMNNQNETENSTQNDTNPTEVAEDICIQEKIDELGGINPADENKIDEHPTEPEARKNVDQRETNQVETKSDHVNSQQNDNRSRGEILIQKGNEKEVSTEIQELPIHSPNDSDTKHIVNPNELCGSKEMKINDEETNNQNGTEIIDKLNDTIAVDNEIKVYECESESSKECDDSKENSKQSSGGTKMDDSETDHNHINITVTKKELVKNEKSKCGEEELMGKSGDNVGNEDTHVNAQENVTQDFEAYPKNEFEHDDNEKSDTEAKLEQDENGENEKTSENVFNIENISSDDETALTDLTKKNNAKNEADVGIIDKVAKNYINYVIDKEKLKYDNDHMDIGNKNTSQKIVNGMENDQPTDSELEKNNDSHSSPDIQKNGSENQSSFDRSKLREELDLSPAEESVIGKETDNTERNELKKNIISTLSIAETGMISAPAKKFINDFISNERSKQFGANEENYNVGEGEKVRGNITEIKSNDTKSEADNDVKPNGLESNKFDRSKVREELQKEEQDSKQTSYKHTSNPHLLQQELDHTFLLKKSTNNNGYSSSLAKAAAVVRIQSMWRGFIVRKSFPHLLNGKESLVHRDENSNVSADEKQELVESEPDTSSDKKNNDDAPELLSSESVRTKRNIDGDDDVFKATRAAIRIQKLWRGFITRKKMTSTRSEIGEDETTVDEIKEGLIPSIKPLVKNEEDEMIDGSEAKHTQNLVPPLNSDNGRNEEDIKVVSVNGLEKHEGVNMKEHIVDASNTDNTLTHPGQRNEKAIDENKERECATKIQSSWRGFLARKFVDQVKMKMKNKIDDEKKEDCNIEEGIQRPDSIDSNDSTGTIIVNDSNKNTEKDTSHGSHLHVFSNNNDDLDDDNTALDEILEYPLIKDEHLIDDYQNKLLDRISGKRSDSSDDFERIGALSPKRIEEIKAEDMKDIDTLHTSLLQRKAVGQEKNYSKVEENYSKSKLESVVEESYSGIISDEKPTLSVNNHHNLASQNNNVDTETVKNEPQMFCSMPSAPSYVSKIIDGKPLSDYVESNLKNENHESKVIENIQNVGNSSKKHSMQSSDLDNVKLLHSGELHDTIVIPLSKQVAESLQNATEKERVVNIQGNESSQSIDSTEELSSILSNVGLLHTGELHDGIVVPISLSSLGKTISSETECNGTDTVDSYEHSVGSSESQTDHKPANDTGGASSVSVQVLRAPGQVFIIINLKS